MRLTIKQAENIAGSLSAPSKMPGYGYGLPALTSCTVGSILATIPNSVCSKCYACKGRYIMPVTQAAQLKRLRAVTNNPLWEQAMIALISRKKEKYFRWHDSGDLLGLWHLEKICRIAVALPDFKFWLPTNEHKIVKDYVAANQLFPPNLVVRISTPMIDSKPINSSFCTSSVHKDKPANGYECQAPLHNNTCGPCRACWNPNIKNVSYHSH
jgi:hypothetical protein